MSVQCATEKGIDPIFSTEFLLRKELWIQYFIKKYFRPLKLNEEGLCEVCAKLRINEKGNEDLPRKERFGCKSTTLSGRAWGKMRRAP